MKLKNWLGIIVIAWLSVSFVACTRTVRVTEQMTWECAPSEYNPAYYAKPNEYVRFRYVENPRCFEVESAKNLCSILENSGKPVITAEFSVWGGRGPLHKEGFRMETVEGHPLVNVGGWGYSGSNDSSGSCPITRIIDSLR